MSRGASIFQDKSFDLYRILSCSRLGLPCQNSFRQERLKNHPNALALELQHCHNLLLTFFKFSRYARKEQTTLIRKQLLTYSSGLESK
jgi:hypothetical protein